MKKPPAPAGEAPPQNEHKTMNELFRSLRHKNYRLFFIGQVISTIGIWLQMTAGPWLVYRLTNSAFLLGVVGFLAQVFVLVLSPLAGTVADHYDRKKLLMLTQSLAMLQAFVMGILVLTGHIQLWHIFVLVAFMGIVSAFDMPVRQAFVVQLVGKEDLMNAIGLNSFIFNSARIIGPALAGILIASAGEGICFILNGVSYIAVFIAVVLIKPIPDLSSNNDQGILSKFVSGYKYIRRSKNIYALLFLLAITGMTGIFPMALMPIIVKDIYKMNASGLGIFMSAMGIGALSGTMIVAARKSIEKLERTIYFSALYFSFFVIAFGLIELKAVALLLLVAIGFFLVLQMSFTNTFIQLTVTDEMRGRVMGFFIMAFMGFAPIGSLMAGSLAHRFGVQVSLVVGGTISIVAALLLKDRILKEQ
ncbi:MAG: MFS transporter [Elusimicrobia bacterium]|nr:MFS transporter [Candidatus Liberimonas magnetica]